MPPRDKTPQEVRVDLEKMLKDEAVNEELWPEVCKMIAYRYYTFYEKLCKAGFTQLDALEIIKVRGTTF